jgi:hypothetical protein
MQVSPRAWPVRQIVQHPEDDTGLGQRLPDEREYAVAAEIPMVGAPAASRAPLVTTAAGTGPGRPMALLGAGVAQSTSEKARDQDSPAGDRASWAILGRQAAAGTARRHQLAQRHLPAAAACRSGVPHGGAGQCVGWTGGAGWVTLTPQGFSGVKPRNGRVGKAEREREPYYFGDPEAPCTCAMRHVAVCTREA